MRYLIIAKAEFAQVSTFFHEQIFFPDKGQLISKWFFGVVDFLKKTNENKSHSSKNEFIRSFFGGNR